MINWIIGGLIIAITLYVIIRTVVRMSKGESACSSCPSAGSSCSCDKKP